MAKLTFPKNPTVGQQYTFEGTVYDWDGFKWVSIYSPSTNLVGLFKKDLADPNSQVVIAGQPARDWQKAPEVPFPDVWIPFTDNLRMLAGYGDDIQVGGYTVATQASFTRASTATYIDKSGVLRTADVNEPRFEKEGLLIEGQSTNLVINSQDLNVGLSTATKNQLSLFEKVTEDGYECYHVILNITSSSVAVENRIDWTNNLVEDGSTVTISAWVKRGATDSGRTRLKGRGTNTNVITGDGWQRVTRTEPISGSTNGIYGFQNQNVGDVIDMYIRCPQIEALPFASSYIPTSGAAATRAADVCSVYISNAGERFGDYTAFCEVHTNGDSSSVGTTASTAKGIYVIDSNPDSFLYIRNRDGKFYHLEVGNNWQLCSSDIQYQNNVTICTRETGPVGAKTRSICVNGVLTTTSSPYTHSPNTKGSTISIGNANRLGSESWLHGHIKNFRIWHRALSDQQLISLR